MGTINKVAPFWQEVLVTEIVSESPTAKTIILKLSTPYIYYAGQHLELRLTGVDGYQAVRDYSISSAPSSGDELAVTIQAISGGEVSGYIHESLKAGDKLEINGPLGYHFIWTDETLGPITLIAGGSGLVPLMSMWREAHLRVKAADMNLLYSVQHYEGMLYKSELLPNLQLPAPNVYVTMVEEKSPYWRGYSRRVDAEMITEVCGIVDSSRRFFICGPTAMVEGVSSLLVQLGYDPELIKTERFGPTGNLLQKPSPDQEIRA